ncbi:MAG: hypothetical protein ABI693_03360 [Bryobacteraceae bacterium]
MKRKQNPHLSMLNLSVEEENFGAIPFAVLERRVGKAVSKIEIEGIKVLPDGTERRVVWQVQGNSELGLPTEQDLDIFVALGVLTFRNNFAKTVSFTGREIGKLLNIGSVHGKFYKRLKIAMDRFIALRFRALTATDRQEEVKWLNVFQEASFLLDRTSGRCIGSVTWTDKVIRSMDSGFFRLLDAGRYMELDGITAKHLYRFLTVAFEKSDLVVIDARKLATEHLGIVNLPKYFSRLLQTLEPAFDQLVTIQVITSYHVVSTEDWKVALHRHPSYVPERKHLLLLAPESDEARRLAAQTLLEVAGLPPRLAAQYCQTATTHEEMYRVERAGRVLESMKEEGVSPLVSVSYVRDALDSGLQSAEGRDLLDWGEIAVDICREKKRAGQSLRNPAGFVVKILKDAEARRRLVDPDHEDAYRQNFRHREEAALRQYQLQEERSLILEYERFRLQSAVDTFRELPEDKKSLLKRDKLEVLSQQERYQRMSPQLREQEVENLILQEIARQEAPAFEKWRLRRKAAQIILPLTMEELHA